MLRRRPAPWFLVALLGLGVGRPVGAQQVAPSVAAAEAVFLRARRVADQVSITRSRGATESLHGLGLPALDSARTALLDSARAALAALPAVRGADSAAVAAMRRWIGAASRPDQAPEAGSGPPVCPAPADSVGERGLSAAIFACYSVAAGRIDFEAEALDRLSILSLLGTTPDRARRERLFRSLDQVWSSVNGHGEPGAPYERLVAARLASWTGPTPVERRGLVLGLDGATVEAWLVRVLESWRAALPDTLLEPWDYYYLVGAASRTLRDRVPLDSLRAVNDRFYRDLGADPSALGVHYDIAPRPGKYPIAFSDFGGRPGPGADGRWSRGEPWVFASYRIGGFDNLNELLHETGHAVHIAAIRTRPAFADWPDSDTFTEGIADLAALEMFEPAWQEKYLGTSVPLPVALRAKYAWMMLDFAWALFEFRVHRAGAPPANEVWADITSRYLGIRPHPELSWWAMRGQLVETAGYMVNYALGAIVVADLRAALVRRYGAFTTGRADWYGQVSEDVYRYGRERPAARVVTDVLGRAPNPDALLADLARIRSPGRR